MFAAHSSGISPNEAQIRLRHRLRAAPPCALTLTHHPPPLHSQRYAVELMVVGVVSVSEAGLALNQMLRGLTGSPLLAQPYQDLLTWAGQPTPLTHTRHPTP